MPPDLSQYPQEALSRDVRVRTRCCAGMRQLPQGPVGMLWCSKLGKPKAPRVLGVAAKTGLERGFVWVWGECICSWCSFALQKHGLDQPRGAPALRAFLCGCGDMLRATSSFRGGRRVQLWQDKEPVSCRASSAPTGGRDTEALEPLLEGTCGTEDLLFLSSISSPVRL